MRPILAFLVLVFSLACAVAMPAVAQTAQRYSVLVGDVSETLSFPSGLRVTRADDEDTREGYRRFAIVSDGTIFEAKTIYRRFAEDRVLADEVAGEFDVGSLNITRTADYRTLVANGTLRKVTKEERRTWERSFLDNSVAQVAKRDKKRPLISRSRPQSPNMMLTRPIGADTLIVGGPKRLSLFFPKGMPLDRVPQGADALFSMASGTCMGKGGVCPPTWDQPTTASSACFGPLPERMHIQGLGVHGPSHTRMSMLGFGEGGYGGTGQIDVYVAPTPDPLFLTLGSENAAIWALNVAPDARIAGILVRGKGSQALSGVPDGVPVRFATKADGVMPGCGSWPTSPFYGWKVEQWGRDLKAITGRSFDAFDSGHNPTHLLIGEWQGIARARQGFTGNPIWGPAGETPQLPLDPIDGIIASTPMSDISFTMKNPKVYGAIFMAICGIYLVIRRKVVHRMRGGKKRKPAPVAWAYLRGMFAGIATFVGLVLSTNDIGMGAGASGSMVFLFMTPVVGALFYMPFRMALRFLAAQGVRRGVSNIGAPAIVAVLAFVGVAQSGIMPGGSGISLNMIVISALSGAAMGWQYWRSLGYPGGSEHLVTVGQRAMELSQGSGHSALLDTAREFRRVHDGAKTAPKRRAASAPVDDVFTMRKKRGRPEDPLP